MTAFPGNSYDAQVTPPETTTPPDADSVDTTVPRYQIGEVAERTGVTQRALRFYEEKGLLQPPERMEGGFRRYSDDDIAALMPNATIACTRSGVTDPRSFPTADNIVSSTPTIRHVRRCIELQYWHRRASEIE